MGQQARAYLADQGHAIAKLLFALKALDPSSVLKRGYSICRDARGKTIKKANTMKGGDPVTAQFAEGSAAMNVTKVMP